MVLGRFYSIAPLPAVSGQQLTPPLLTEPTELFLSRFSSVSCYQVQWVLVTLTLSSVTIFFASLLNVTCTWVFTSFVPYSVDAGHYLLIPYHQMMQVYQWDNTFKITWSTCSFFINRNSCNELEVGSTERPSTEISPVVQKLTKQTKDLDE